MTKKTRGKPSKVDLLPGQIKSRLDKLLRDKKFTQADILEQVNQAIDASGLSDDLKLSRSGLNRYATSMETVGQRIREARAISDQWISKLGTEPTGEVSQLLIEMVRTLAFDQVLKMSDSGETVEPKMLKDLSHAIERLEKAAVESTKREIEIRKRIAEEVETDLRGADGMSEDLENRIRGILLGKE